MYATIVYADDTTELIEVNGHKLQYGGYGGDGFCYSHSSFDCVDKLTVEEKNAIEEELGG